MTLPSSLNRQGTRCTAEVVRKLVVRRRRGGMKCGDEHEGYDVAERQMRGWQGFVVTATCSQCSLRGGDAWECNPGFQEPSDFGRLRCNVSGFENSPWMHSGTN